MPISLISPRDLPPQLQAMADAIPSGTGGAERELGSLLNLGRIFWSRGDIPDAFWQVLHIHIQQIAQTLGYPPDLILEIADKCHDVTEAVNLYLSTSSTSH